MSAVALVTDLMFATKIKGTADAVGVPLSLVRSVQALDDAAAAGLSFAIVDLHADGVDVLDAIRRAKSPRMDGREQTAAAPTGSTPAPVVIAFASHVQADLMQSAREAGADVVLPRSRFSHDLPDLLTKYGRMPEGR